VRIRRAISRFCEIHEAAGKILKITAAVIFVVIGFLYDWMHLSTSALKIRSMVDWGITILFIMEFTERLSAAYSPLGYLRGFNQVHDKIGAISHRFQKQKCSRSAHCELIWEIPNQYESEGE
jgi:hypothetical protein